MAKDLDSFDMGSKDAPFNMAIATLKRIDDMLREYSKISALAPNDGNSQILKYKTLRQIYLAAVPLMSKEHQKEVKKSMNEIEMKTTRLNGRTVVIYSADFDVKLDDIVETILNSLQEFGHYFMPEMDESDLF